MKNLVVFGSNGQLGTDLIKSLKKDYNVYSFSKKECDICDYSVLKRKLVKINPTFIINAAAFTKVDEAETNIDEAFKVNHHSIANFTKLSKEMDFVFIHFSTDYVFNSKNNIPIKEDDAKDPINVYGESKLMGEEEIVNSLDKFFIFRVCWVYGKSGNNFPKTILKLARTKKELNVVNDQIGCPTPTSLICDVVAQVIRENEEDANNYGIYHISPNGACSWFDVANEILKFTQTKSNLFTLENINPVDSSQFPTEAKRPSYSYLDNTKVIKTFRMEFHNWRFYLKEFLNKLELNDA